MTQAAPLTVLQLTDCHFLAEARQEILGIDTEKYFIKVLDQAFAGDQHYDVLLLTGDLAQDPCVSSYQRLQRHLLELPVPVICLAGNHDDFGIMQTLLNTNNISCAQLRVFEHWQIVCLNSQIPGKPGGFLSDNELSILTQALAEHPMHHTLCAIHHHCVPTHSAWLDTMLITNSAQLLNILTANPQAKAVVSGHIHQDLTQQIQHLQVIGTPSTCFQFTPNSHNFSLDDTAPGYRKLFLYPDGTLTTQVFRLPEALSELRLGDGYLEP